MIVNNCMFFMLDSQYFSFSFIKGMKIETCDCLQKEDADICSLLFVSIYRCLIIFHECSGLELPKGEKCQPKLTLQNSS